MTRLICLISTLALLFSPPAFASSHLSSDENIVQARTLVDAKRYQDALNILRTLPAGHPDQTDIDFLTGLAAMRLSE